MKVGSTTSAPRCRLCDAAAVLVAKALVALVASGAACQTDERPKADAASPPSAAAPQPSVVAPPSSAAPTSAAAPDRRPAAAVSTGEDSITSFRVEGVAADDVLNLRHDPDSNARLLGSIPAGATRIEGIGAPTVAGGARWQLVRHGGTIGWVNARFLSADAGSTSGTQPTGRVSSPINSPLAPLICFGTEPFWAIRFGVDGSATCEAMCEGPPGLRLAQLKISLSSEPESFDLLTADRRIYLRAAMRRTGQCSDGMSDLAYPYEFVGVGTPGQLRGCCRVDKESPNEPRP